MIKAIIFDLDDTLISEEEYIKSGFKFISNKIGEKYKLPIDEVFSKMMNLFYKNSKNVFNRVLDYYEIDYDKETVEFLIKEYRQHNPNIKFYEDVVEILSKLKINGYKLGIITDGYKETQIRKIDALSCKRFFDEIIITDELGKEFWKPHERAYKLMAKKLNVELKEMLYIGDNLKKDFITANKLGIYTCRIIRENSIYADLKISKEYFANVEFKELTDIFKYI
ncbi:HAD family hydrolase [Clostridium sardiniense]|uniref:HAD family hydrolase n=1 Tax=Clostridium sardiniense TaxID=29369 RepID=UPI003D334E0B